MDLHVPPALIDEAIWSDHWFALADTPSRSNTATFGGYDNADWTITGENSSMRVDFDSWVDASTAPGIDGMFFVVVMMQHAY